MRACTGSSTRVCHHERKAMRGERVFQLAWHHGCTANCVRWVTGTEFFICENGCAASLEKENTGLQTCIKGKSIVQLQNGIQPLRTGYVHPCLYSLCHPLTIKFVLMCMLNVFDIYSSDPLYSHQTLQDSCFLNGEDRPCSSPAAQQFSSSLQTHLAHSLLQHRMYQQLKDTQIIKHGNLKVF